jgi:hypothetical protein
LVIVNDLELVEDSGVIAPFCSDHHATWMSHKDSHTRLKIYNRQVWYYERGDYVSLCELQEGGGFEVNIIFQDTNIIDKTVQLFTGWLLQKAKKIYSKPSCTSL